MKKKLVLLFTTSLASVMAVTSLLLVSKDDKQNNFARGSGEPIAYTLDYESVRPVEGQDNTYVVDLVSGKGDKVEVRIKNATLTENEFASSESDGSMYFYNTDPIRGISTSAFYVNGGEHESYAFVGDVFLSKNEIDIDDVLGSKYDDLIYQSFYYYGCFGPHKMEGTNELLPGLNQCRYFYMRVSGDTPDFCLTGLEFESVCQDEIIPDPIGENYGVLSESEQAAVNYLFGNSFTLNQTGNGAWALTQCYFRRYKENNVGLAQCVKSGETSEIVSAMLDNGYSFKYSEDNIDVYQKRNGDDVHTIEVTKYEYSLFDKYEFLYDDGYPYIPTSSVWPSSILEETFTSEHCNAILEIDSNIVESYAYEAEDYGNMKAVRIVANLKSTATEQEVANLVELIESYYTEGDWHLSEATRFYVYSDPTFMAVVQPETKSIEFMFGEDHPSVNPPTAAEIASALSINESLVVVPTGGESARYSIEGYSSGQYLAYRIYYSTSTDFENIDAFLASSGYTLQSSSSDPLAFQYRRQLDSYGSFCYINVELIEGSIYVTFIANKPYRVYSDIKAALNNQFGIDSEILNLLFADVTITSSFNYICLYNARNVLVQGAKGSTFVSEITASSNLTYVEPYDGYTINGSNYLITFSEYGDDIRIDCTWKETTTFYTYTAFNDAVINYFGEGNVDSLVLFEGDDNLIQGFKDPSMSYNSFTYHAPLSEINRVYTLFTERLEESGFDYSNYLDCYINPEKEFGYQVEIGADGGSYCLRISLERRQFEDFESYNDLHIGDYYSVYNYFPPLVDSDNYNRDMFVNPYGHDEYFSVTISKEFNIATYVSQLRSDGYVSSEETGYDYEYSKVENGCVYCFYADEFNRGYYLYFYRYDGFGSAASLLTSIKNEPTKDYLISMGFSECFTSEGATYRLEDAFGDQGITFSALDEDEINAYRTYLLSQGFTTNYWEERYVKNINDSYSAYDIVEIDNYGLYYWVTIYRVTYNFVSWEDVLTRFEEESYPYSSISQVIPYPDDATGNFYRIGYIDRNSLNLTIKGDYNIQSYIDYLCSITGQDYKEGENDFHFSLEYGNVNVRIHDTCIQVEIYCYSSFIDVPSATSVGSLGTNPVTLTPEYQFFEFVPEEDGFYRFTTDGEGIDTYGVLCTENGVVIEEDDNSGEEDNFLIAQYLQNGVSYYIAVRLSGVSGEAETNLIISSTNKS